MDLLRGAALVAATMTTGLVAGVFGLYAHTIMPGLRRTDDRTFVAAFQSIDTVIINPGFPASFIGALLLTGLAAALHLGADNRSVLPWIASAFVLYPPADVITLAVNAPRNDAIKAAGPHARVMVRGSSTDRSVRLEVVLLPFLMLVAPLFFAAYRAGFSTSSSRSRQR